MLATLGALLLLAAPVKVAVPGFTIVGMDMALGDAWADSFVTRLGADTDFKLISSKDIAAVLGLERQKELLGCGEAQTSCLAELAGALGVDAILSGTFAQSGTSITATLRVLKSSDGSQIAASTSRLKDGEALQDWLEVQAGELGGKMRVAFGLPARAGAAVAATTGSTPTSTSTVSSTSSSGGGSSIVRLVPGILGAAALITGGVLFGLSKGSASRLQSPEPLTSQQISELKSGGRTFEGAGVGLMIGGGVAIAASVVWMIAAPRSEVRVAIVPAPFGGAAIVGGSF